MKSYLDETCERELIELIRQCGDFAKEAYGEVQQGEYKADGTIVTKTDRQVEERLRAFLLERFPDHRILGEEEGFTGPQEGNLVWAVDPIDGTSNFANGLPIWGVSVGLLDDGRPVWGCIYLPVLDQIFLAREGRGATLNGRTASPSPVTKMENEGIFSITAGGIENYDYHFPMKIRGMGSAAAQVSYVACGFITGYFIETWSVWDIAAALLIAKEAGARITEHMGKDFHTFPRLQGKGGPPLLFAAPGIHDQVAPLIAPKQKTD